MNTRYPERDYDFGQSMFTLRNEIGLTQEQLGNLLGVTTRTVRGWEAGSSYPKTKHLKQLIELAVQHQAFPKDSEAEEIRRLWNAARQRARMNESWLSTLLAGQDDQQPHMDAHAQEERGQNRKDGDGPLAVPTLQNLPFPQNPFFTGRESELALIAHFFERDRRVAITQPISVSGLGGIGKTQLALEYAHRCHPSLYRCVLWVNASDKASLEASYLSLAHLLKLPEKQEREIDRIVQAVKIWLEQQSHWLLILDNADDLLLARSYLPPKPRGHILLTTRSQMVGNMATLLQVEAMPPQEGLLFLLQRSGVLKRGSDLESITSGVRREAGALVEMLSGHPLALDQAGAYIEETGDLDASATFPFFLEYKHIYQQNHYLLLKRRGFSGDEHPETVALTFEISIHKACELHPSCADILAFCSLLHPDAIPEELLCQESGLNLDFHLFNEAISALRRYSLVKRDPGKKEISVHRLVQAVIREDMDIPTLRVWMERVVQAVNNAFPKAEFEQWNKCQQLLAHVQFCAAWLKREVVAPADAAHLLRKAGIYLRERGQYSDALPLHQQSLTIREQHLEASHPDTAKSLHSLALTYHRQGKYELAEPLFLRVLAIYEQHLGTDHPDTARSLNNLALLYRQQGKYELAEPLHQRALAIYEQHLGAEHPEMALSLNNLAELYRLQGKYELAEGLFLRALSIREQQLGTEHPKTADSLNDLAILYWQQGKYEQAEGLYQRALAIREQRLGAEHPETAASLNNLAILYKEQGKYELAEDLYLRVLAIWEQRLGAEHPNTAAGLNNLAEVYQKQGKYEQAEDLYQRALAIWEQRLGAEHPNTAEALHGLATLYQQQEKYDLAEPLFLRALHIREKCLGPDHPQTQVSREAYAAFIRNREGS